MRGFIVSTVITAIAFYVLTRFLPDYVSYDGDTIGLVVLALIFGVVNGLIGPIVKTLALPLTLMTMGLVGFAINAGLLLVTAVIANSTGFDLTIGDFPPELLTIDTIVAAVVGAIVLGVVGSAARLVIPD
jgi:putative membrane protein